MKRYFLYALLGALVGIAVEYLVSIVISIKLNLGYLMTYITTLEEAVHGEMNAVMLEAALCGFLGMNAALAVSFARQKAWPLRRRCIATGAAAVVGCLPILVLTLYLLYGLG